MRALKTALTLSFCCCSVLPAVDTGFLDRSFSSAGTNYRYQVYVPVDWVPTQKWPVVLYLHGVSQRGSDGMSHMNEASAETIRADRGRFPAIFVFPQARPDTTWATQTTQEMALGELDAAVKDFNGDVNRVYLTGFSMGGAGAVRLAARWPERFAALVAISPWIRPDLAFIPPQVAEDDVRTHPFLRPQPYEGMAARLSKLPVWIFHSETDQVVPVTESRQLVAALKTAGVMPRYVEYSGADHNQTNVNVWADKSLMIWLLAQRKK